MTSVSAMIALPQINHDGLCVCWCPPRRAGSKTALPVISSLCTQGLARALGHSRSFTIYALNGWLQGFRAGDVGGVLNVPYNDVLQPHWPPSHS